MESFKRKVKGKPVSFWADATELHGHVAIALGKAITTRPRPGWTRGDQQEALEEVARLSKENASLRAAASAVTRNRVCFDIRRLYINAVRGSGKDGKDDWVLNFTLAALVIPSGNTVTLATDITSFTIKIGHLLFPVLKFSNFAEGHSISVGGMVAVATPDELSFSGSIHVGDRNFDAQTIVDASLEWSIAFVGTETRETISIPAPQTECRGPSISWVYKASSKHRVIRSIEVLPM